MFGSNGPCSGVFSLHARVAPSVVVIRCQSKERQLQGIGVVVGSDEVISLPSFPFYSMSPPPFTAGQQRLVRLDRMSSPQKTSGPNRRMTQDFRL